MEPCKYDNILSENPGAGFTKGLKYKSALKYANLSLTELVFTKRKLKYAFLSLDLSLGQYTTILKSTPNSCNMIGRELRFRA